jgi:hypothetical protein
MVRSKKTKVRKPSNALRPATATDPAPIVAATIDYERWLHKRIDVVEPDLQLKHKDMAGSLFAFLRATFYRWASLWPEALSYSLNDAMNVSRFRDRGLALGWRQRSFAFRSSSHRVFDPEFGVEELIL